MYEEKPQDAADDVRYEIDRVKAGTENEPACSRLSYRVDPGRLVELAELDAERRGQSERGVEREASFG